MLCGRKKRNYMRSNDLDKNFILKIEKNVRSAMSINFAFSPYDFQTWLLAFSSEWKTYRFFLFFHPTRHLWHCPVDCRILVQIRQFLLEKNGHWLRGIERPSSKWKFSRHFFLLSPRFLLIRKLILFCLFFYCRPLAGPSGDRKSFFCDV